MNINNYIPIVLCAGYGTRLKPLTDFIPKVACPIIDKPVAFMNIEIFLKAGFPRVHCNIHYLSEQVKSEITKAAEFYGYDPTRIVFWHEPEILETGGGISRIYKENKEKKDAIIVSGDIAANFPLAEMLERWERKTQDELALMCTKDINYQRKDTTWVTHDNNFIRGFGEHFAEKENCLPKVFTTHQIISHTILEDSKIEKTSSVNLFFRKILSQNKKIINFNYSHNNYWFDIGTPDEYLKCIKFFKNIKNNADLYDNNILINKSFSDIPPELKLKLIPVSQKIENEKIIIKFKNSEENNLYLINDNSNESMNNIYYFIQ